MSAMRLVKPLQSVLQATPGASGGIAVGGHRGVGMNLFVNSGCKPAYRENTLKSFLAAADAGASFVEFDVQVTKDGIPIVWHDDNIIRGNPTEYKATEIRDTSFSDFQLANMYGSNQAGSQSPLLRSTCEHPEVLQPWRCDIEDSLPTLETLFCSIPHDVAFDIEVKMVAPPTGSTCTEPAEVARTVDAILEIVEKCSRSSQRYVFFSSFDPAVCIRLRSKTRYPVYFLSHDLVTSADAGKGCLESALDFAVKESLQGVVLPAALLLANKSYTKAVCDKGLRVMSYGLENTSIVNVKEQCQLGVDAVIVDHVDDLLSEMSS